MGHGNERAADAYDARLVVESLMRKRYVHGQRQISFARFIGPLQPPQTPADLVILHICAIGRSDDILLLDDIRPYGLKGRSRSQGCWIDSSARLASWKPLRASLCRGSLLPLRASLCRDSNQVHFVHDNSGCEWRLDWKLP